MIFMSVILLLPVLIHHGYSKKAEDMCPALDRCRCIADSEKGFEMTCNNVTSRFIADLTMENVTSIRIRDYKLNDTSVLSTLRTNDNGVLTSISLTRTNINVFDWSWMPGRGLYKVSLVSTNTSEMYSKKIATTDGAEFECGMEHIRDIRILHLLEQNQMVTIPTCIPESTEKIFIAQTRLSELAEDRDESGRVAIKWPKSLRYLSLSSNEITSVAERVFAGAPAGLLYLRIADQPVEDPHLFRKLPAAVLKILIVQGCGIRESSPDDWLEFRRHNRLQSLKLSYNELVSIPRGLPASLNSLQLDNNKITSIDAEGLSHMVNLTILLLNRNRITGVVPPGLPRTLKNLQLRYNQITECRDDAFVYMRNLELLDLSYNSLNSMPKNIPRSIRDYNLQVNKIYFIGPHANYAFCSQCNNFKLSGNPWVCDTHMVTFFLWANANGFESFSIKEINKNEEIFRCQNSPFRGLDNWRLENLIDYMKKMQDLGCDYNVEVLNCTEVGLEKYSFHINGLKEVYVSDNPLIGNAPDFVFAKQFNLRRLELNRNGLTRIPYGLPNTIDVLSLVGNNLTELNQRDVDALRNLTSIRVIYLDQNKLTTLLLSAIQPLKTLQWISLTGNPLTCDCTIWPFTTWLNDRKKEFSNSESCGTCEKPLRVRGFELSQLKDYYGQERACVPSLCSWSREESLLNCSYEVQRRLSIQSYPKREVKLGFLPTINSSEYWQSIDVSGMQLQNSNEIRLVHLSHLKHAKLSNNSLKHFPIFGLPRSIENLTLDNNNISALPPPEKIQRRLPELQHIDLRNNNIKRLSEEQVRLLPLKTSLLLHGNPLICDCQLRPLVGWIFTNKDNPEVVKHHRIKYLKCHSPESLKGKYIANITEAQYCPTQDIRAVIGGLVGGVAIFTFGAIFVNIYLHKKRKKREKEDILRGFRELLQREAGFAETDPETGIQFTERFTYDAFLSYSPQEDDSDFAMVLLEELEEKRSYKICVHERDFVPGVGIADNIVECIGASRRIILIVSRNFVSSPWCQYEVQVALAELHQKRRSKLLIPVLLEDIAENENIAGSVKTFLSLIQGIRIPKSHKESSWREFWHELVSAMPEEPMGDQVR